VELSSKGPAELGSAWSSATDRSRDTTQIVNVFATSTDTFVIPNPVISYPGYPSTTATLTYTPQPNISGPVIIGCSGMVFSPQKLGLVENGVSCSSWVQQDRSCVCR
jgi:hypothetical protein